MRSVYPLFSTLPGLSHPDSWVRGRLSAERTEAEDAGIRQEELPGADENIRGHQFSARGSGPEQINCDLCQNVA